MVQLKKQINIYDKVSIIFFDVNFLYYRRGGEFLKKLKWINMTKGMTSTNQTNASNRKHGYYLQRNHQYC